MINCASLSIVGCVDDRDWAFGRGVSIEPPLSSQCGRQNSVRRKTDKPNYLPQSLVRGVTHRAEESSWTTDPETGRRMPEPERVSVEEAEKMAEDNRVRFQTLKEIELAHKKRKATVQALDREWRQAINEDRAASTGGTVHFGKFKRIWQ
jgi:hypothetical protein